MKDGKQIPESFILFVLGRKAIEGDFVVDVSKKYLLRRW